jgi:hypothetical protein
MTNRITTTFPKNAKINVSTTAKNRVQVSNKGGIGGGTGAKTLRELLDVDATQSSQNDVLVYEEGLGKFVIEELPRINGGTF